MDHRGVTGIITVRLRAVTYLVAVSWLNTHCHLPLRLTHREETRTFAANSFPWLVPAFAAIISHLILWDRTANLPVPTLRNPLTL